MSKEKQIEEMAKILLKDCEGACTECAYYEKYAGVTCIPFRMANELYNAGYRKQSEGEWEQRTDIVGFVRCSVCKDCNVADDWLDGKKWKYCPQCGAKMKGGAE